MSISSLLDDMSEVEISKMVLGEQNSIIQELFVEMLEKEIEKLFLMNLKIYILLRIKKKQKLRFQHLNLNGKRLIQIW